MRQRTEISYPWSSSAQLGLFRESEKTETYLKAQRSGTFVDNMKLPIHRWFRYSAGFSAEWVVRILNNWGASRSQEVLDPFAGSGTVQIASDQLGLKSIGVEAHPMVSRILGAKLAWASSIQQFQETAAAVLNLAEKATHRSDQQASLLTRSYSPASLVELNKLRHSWQEIADDSEASELAWLAVTAILRTTSRVGTAQWQYILPNKDKKRVEQPRDAYVRQVAMMVQDMAAMQAQVGVSKALALRGDARTLEGVADASVDFVITSPPYANNYDYADALRLEMTYWGDVSSWADIHDAVRKHLIVSSSQHSSRERLNMHELLADSVLEPIRVPLSRVVEELSNVRQDHGGKKHYHTMVAAYYRDLAQVFIALRRVCKPGARVAWVIGDSAPYGVYCPADVWLGELALAAGFGSHRFEQIRERNTKWKNRKHRVPLKEGILWIEN